MSRPRSTSEKMAHAGNDKLGGQHAHAIPMARSPNGRATAPVAILSGILFLSGIGALIFETLWLRISGLAFGNSVWAAALILSSFMAGLALGNAIAASSRIRRSATPKPGEGGWRPLHLYAVLEVLVALFGCTIVFGLPVLGELLRPAWQMLWNYQPALLGLRFIVSFLILLMPTTAMGLTLPVLMEDSMLRQTNFGRAIGFLYGSNTLGAVVGAVLGEAYLIAAFGLRGTALAASLMSCIAAAAALFVAKFAGDTGALAWQRTFPLRLDVRYRPPWRLLFVSFGTGCVLLALEVIWFRFLRLYVASSSTAFAVMLAVVLAGIGLGSILGSALGPRAVFGRWPKKSSAANRAGNVQIPADVSPVGSAVRRAANPADVGPAACGPQSNLLPILLLLAAVLVLLSYWFFPSALVPASVAVFELSWWRITLLATALMFPVALISGILFPSIAAGVQAAVGDRMNSTGITTLFNTIGAALGPLLASFLLLPGIGYQWSLILCAAAYALLSVPVTSGVNGRLRNLLQKAIKQTKVPNQKDSLLSSFPSVGIPKTLVGLWAVLVLVFVIFPYRRAETHFAHASRPYETEYQGQLLARVVKRIEGTSDTWQLLRRDLFGEPYYYRLLSNAFSMSATNPHGQRYMRLFAYLPLAFRPESQDVLLLCYGCGITADALLHGPNVTRLDVVDISKEVFRLADFYSGINYTNPLHDPRVATFVQDGRFFLQATPRQYDIISGEPPPPKNAGAVNLYTEEFFSLMKSRLKQGGIATFWLPINQLKVDEAKAILRAFHNAFPNASVWASADQEWIMMGINGPGRKVKEEEIRQLWSNTHSGADLRRIGIEVPQQLGALFVMDGEEIDLITREVAPLTDIYPKRLTDEPWDEEANHRFAFRYLEALSAVQRFLRSNLVKSIWPETLNESLESLFVLRQTRYLSEVMGSNKLAELDLYLRHSRLRIPVLEVLGSNGFRLGIAERIARKEKTPPLETMPDLIAEALARRDIAGAVQLMEDEKGRGTFNRNDTLLLTYLYCLNGSVEKAEALAADNAAAIKKDEFVDWLWGKLESDFGFHPPR